MEEKNGMEWLSGEETDEQQDSADQQAPQNNTVLKRIQKLSDDVINRIAAGEVIKKPSNAVKELLENCLDAGATSISIVIKDGGMKLIQITDNGCGISKDDLGLVCARHTTSKLQTFDDLKCIQTFGFRGEALASISYVAHVTIISKPSNQDHAFKALYRDGVLKDGIPPKPCAFVNGTQIMVEDLFYNSKIRRHALKNTSEEYRKIINLVTKYALHNYHTSITLKKQGESRPDVHTAQCKTMIDNIRLLYGKNISRECLSVEHRCEKLDYGMTCFFTNPNYHVKEMKFILFINNRLVSNGNLKKGMDSLYDSYLPKGTHPFIYLSLTMNPHNLDVNVHPAKETVNFIRENEILEDIQIVIREKLMSCNSSRVYYAHNAAATFQTPSLPSPKPMTSQSSKCTTEISKVQSQGTLQPCNTVRLTEQRGSIERFIQSNKRQKTSHDSPYEPITKKNTPIATTIEDDSENEEDPEELESIMNIISQVKKNCHDALHEIVRNHTFVGWVNPCLSLIQYQTKLFIVDVNNLSISLMYQIVIRKFAKFRKIKLSEPLDIMTLLRASIESNTEAEGSEIENQTQMKNLQSECSKILKSLSHHSEMLSEYFSIEIKAGKLLSLPQLLPSYFPPLHRLPDFLFNLATKVEWTQEQECFHSIAVHLSLLYCVCEEHEVMVGPKSAGDDNMVTDNDESECSSKWIVENVILPACKLALLPPKEFANDGTIVEVASLADLYKVFERC